MVNFIKRTVLLFLAVVVGASTLVSVFFSNQAQAAGEVYKFIDNKTVGAYQFTNPDRDMTLIRTYVAKSPLVLWNINNDENGGVYLDAPIKSSSNGGICSDRIHFKGTSQMWRVTRTKGSGACQAAETRTAITVNADNYRKFFTAQANGSLLSINNIPMVRVPSDATIFVENNLSAKCPAMLRKNGNDVWGVIGAEPKANGTVEKDSEGRTEAYWKYAAAALGEDKFGNCQIGGNDQKSYSQKAAALLMGGSADKWNDATGGRDDYISIKPGDNHHDGMPFGSITGCNSNAGCRFTSWGNPVKEYKGTIDAPVTNCDVYLDKFLRQACQSGFENDGADYCTNTYSLSFAEGPQGPERITACIVGQTIAANGIHETPQIEDTCLADATDCTDKPETSCVIDGIGWIVCPVLNAIGGVSDAMYGWISSILLLNPLQMEDASGNPTPQYTGWKTIRDISNVLLVIAFLIIIFSQITSIGVTNYGIKKLLPRVILVAVLVNVSFLVMMITIDVVNLIGTSLYNILVGLAPDVTGSSIAADNAIGSFVTGILTGSLVGAGVTIAGGLIGAPALALLAVPFIIVAVLALFAAIATLFVRNALVIILVLLAPLAFAAFLLPNTKSLFDRWRKLTVGILFLYPTAALLFGGTKFAAYTLANDDQPLSILVAVFVMAAPLGLLPWLAASSGGILGTIGGRLQGLAKSARSPLQRAFKSRVDNQRERYQSGQNTLFGRRRTQSEFDQRQIDTATGRRRRNWGERLNQTKISRDTDTENAKATQKTNVNERGLVGTSRRDQRFGDINRQAERLSDQKSSQAADYRQQVDRMIATPGTVDAQRQARKFDAEQATEGYNATTKLRNQQRIINNVASTATGVVDATGATINLGDQATATYGVNEEIKAAEGDILRINRTSGVAAAAIDRQKENEEFLKGLDADEQAEYDRTLDVDPARRARAIQTADSQLTSARVRSEVKSESDARTDVGGPMFQEEMRRRAAEKESNATKGRLDTFQTEAATNSTDPRLAALDPATRARLQASDRAERISGGALNSAQRVAQRQFDQDIIANPALATQIGGIDPLGASRAEAEALQREKEALDKAVAAEYKRFETGGAGGAGEDPDDLLHMIASGNLPRGGGVANEEQIEAAIQYIAENGTVDQQMLLADVIAGGQYHDFTAPGVVNPAGRAPIPPRISQAYGIANRKSKLQSTSGTNSNRYNTNQPVPGYTQQIIERARGGKHTVEKWAGMDVDEMRRFSTIPVGNLTSTPPTPAEIAGLAADAGFLREALADKDIKAFDFEKTGYLHTILANLEVAAGIPATPPPTRP